MVDRLRYDKDLGKLYWKPMPLSHFKDDAAMRRWNTRWAGREAGNIVKPGRNVSYVEISMTANGTRQRLYSHRIIWEMENGPIPEGMQIDHIDGDGTNNRIENLRLATRSQNLRNRGAQINSSTGIKGVYEKPNGKYAATVNNIYIGSYDTIDQASEAYRVHAQKLHGEFFRQ